MKSKILVFIQFLIIFLMCLSFFTTSTTFTFLGLSISLVGVFIGLTAIQHHQKGNFNIRPDIKENCILITHGIYKYIRHPMYLSVLTMMLGVLVLYPSWKQLFLYILLIITLLVKLRYEESLWVCHNQEYQHYKKQTKQLIPFIF